MLLENCAIVLHLFCLWWKCHNLSPCYVVGKLCHSAASVLFVMKMPKPCHPITQSIHWSYNTLGVLLLLFSKTVSHVLQPFHLTFHLDSFYSWNLCFTLVSKQFLYFGEKWVKPMGYICWYRLGFFHTHRQ